MNFLKECFLTDFQNKRLVFFTIFLEHYPSDNPDFLRIFWRATRAVLRNDMIWYADILGILRISRILLKNFQFERLQILMSFEGLSGRQPRIFPKDFQSKKKRIFMDFVKDFCRVTIVYVLWIFKAIISKHPQFLLSHNKQL